MSRAYVAIVPSSSPDGATILAPALFICSSVGSGVVALSLSHSPSSTVGSMYLLLNQSSDTSRQTAPRGASAPPPTGNGAVKILAHFPTALGPAIRCSYFSSSVTSR